MYVFVGYSLRLYLSFDIDNEPRTRKRTMFYYMVQLLYKYTQLCCRIDLIENSEIQRRLFEKSRYYKLHEVMIEEFIQNLNLELELSK